MTTSMPVIQFLPTRGTVDLGDVLRDLREAPVTAPFDQSRIDYISDLATRLRRKGRGLPETQALAYWMRKAELHRLEDSFAELGNDRCLLMPRGTVFHVPPANVDTLFVYSWVLSTLVGNRNIVRLSSRATDQSNLILDTMRETVVDHPEVAGSTTMLSYGHDDRLTAAISAECDVRVIWGGDGTVNRIRTTAIPPHATELVFADRFSMAAVATDAYRELDDAKRDQLAELFFNDAYWFDQLGCSSARLVLWAGAQDPQPLAEDFYGRVRAVARAKSYQVDPSAAIAKFSQACRTMIEADVSAYSAPDNTMSVLTMDGFPDVRGEFCGAGLFYQLRVTALAEIVPHIRRADQTLTAFGFGEDELRDLVRALRGRGIDRIVPFGQALQFNRFWDGYDLLAEFTRKVTLSAGNPLA